MSKGFESFDFSKPNWFWGGCHKLLGLELIMTEYNTISGLIYAGLFHQQ